MLLGGEYSAPSSKGLFTLRGSSILNLGVRKQFWQENAVLSLNINDLFCTNGCFSALHYQKINTDWVNRRDSC